MQLPCIFLWTSELPELPGNHHRVLFYSHVYPPLNHDFNINNNNNNIINLSMWLTLMQLPETGVTVWYISYYCRVQTYISTVYLSTFSKSSQTPYRVSNIIFVSWPLCEITFFTRWTKIWKWKEEMWASLLIPHAHNDEFLVFVFFLFEILPKYVGRGVSEHFHCFKGN